MSSSRWCKNAPPSTVTVTATAAAVRVEICGEVDLSNHDRLQAALSGVDVYHADALYLDLRGLTFCEVAGCWALLMFERDARLSGHPTNIYGATRTFQRVLSLLAAGDEPSFV